MASNNHEMLAKFHSGTLRIMDTIRLMLLFSIIARKLIGIRLKSSEHPKVPGDLVKNVKQINSQSDLTSISSFDAPLT